MPFWFNGRHHRTIEVALLGAFRISAMRVPAPHLKVLETRRSPKGVTPWGIVALTVVTELAVLHRGHHVFRAVEALRGRVAHLIDYAAFGAVLLQLSHHLVLRGGE